jgi:signal transduction histidine kinase
MLEEADRLTRLVDALLHLARADTGRIALKKVPLDLYDVAENAAAQLGVLADERSQVLKVQGTKGTSLDADRVLMNQAVLNLLDNAIAYGPPSSEIVLEVAAADGWGEISVHDRGPGIPPEHQARIFERFYRVDDSRARDQGGFGLGLAIAKWSVEAHGGTLTVDSAPGDGSTFRIRLPRAA